MAKNVDIFQDFRTNKGPKESAFKKLDELVKQLTQAEADVEKAQDDLKKAQARLKQLDEFAIPEYMDEMELKEFTNRAGIKIEAKSTVYASIGDRKVKAFAWLIKNNHSALIKRSVAVAFNVAQGDEAKALFKELLEREGLESSNIKQDMKVEAQSLVAFVRKQLKEGKEVPADVFGIYNKRSTKITLPPSE